METAESLEETLLTLLPLSSDYNLCNNSSIDNNDDNNDNDNDNDNDGDDDNNNDDDGDDNNDSNHDNLNHNHHKDDRVDENDALIDTTSMTPITTTIATTTTTAAAETEIVGTETEPKTISMSTRAVIDTSYTQDSKSLAVFDESSKKLFTTSLSSPWPLLSSWYMPFHRNGVEKDERSIRSQNTYTADVFIKDLSREQCKITTKHENVSENTIANNNDNGHNHNCIHDTMNENGLGLARIKREGQPIEEKQEQDGVQQNKELNNSDWWDYVRFHVLCHLCEKEFLDDKNYTIHLKNSHYNGKYNERLQTHLQWLQCPYPYCERQKSRHSTNFVAHLIMHYHRDKRPYLCKVFGCQVRASTRQNMKLHLRKSHYIYVQYQPCPPQAQQHHGSNANGNRSVSENADINAMRNNASFHLPMSIISDLAETKLSRPIQINGNSLFQQDQNISPNKDNSNTPFRSTALLDILNRVNPPPPPPMPLHHSLLRHNDYFLPNILPSPSGTIPFVAPVSAVPFSLPMSRPEFSHFATPNLPSSKLYLLETNRSNYPQHSINTSQFQRYFGNEIDYGHDFPRKRRRLNTGLPWS